MTEFNVLLSELNIKISANDKYIRDFCGDYITEDTAADFTAMASEKEIDAETLNFPDIPRRYSESICIYRSIARRLPDYSRFVFHGAAITYQNDGFIFTAPSGTGKTTHIGLWNKYLGKSVGIVNGDKPIISLQDGVTVYGTPWAGKENLQKNRKADVKAICLIKRGTSNTVRKLNSKESVDFLMHQVYLPDVPAALVKTLSLVDTLLKRVPCYEATIDMSENAVKATFEALTGKEYKRA